MDQLQTSNSAPSAQQAMWRPTLRNEYGLELDLESFLDQVETGFGARSVVVVVVFVFAFVYLLLLLFLLLFICLFVFVFAFVVVY